VGEETVEPALALLVEGAGEVGKGLPGGRMGKEDEGLGAGMLEAEGFLNKGFRGVDRKGLGVGPEEGFPVEGLQKPFEGTKIAVEEDFVDTGFTGDGVNAPAGKASQPEYPKGGIADAVPRELAVAGHVDQVKKRK